MTTELLTPYHPVSDVRTQPSRCHLLLAFLKAEYNAVVKCEMFQNNFILRETTV